MENHDKRKAKMNCSKTASVALSLALTTAFADPSVKITSASVESGQDGGVLSVRYQLSDESAIVTLGADVTAAGVRPLSADWMRRASGDVNRLVEPGTERSIECPIGDADLELFGKGKARVRITLWSPAQPPDYMSAEIGGDKAVRYYASTNALPYPATNHYWMVERILFRKIPATGVNWRMTSVSQKRIVTSNIDYYFSVFPYTCGQYKTLHGTDTTKALSSYLDGQRDYSPLCGYSYADLRGTCDVNNRAYPLVEGSELYQLNAQLGVSVDIPTEAQWEYACRAGCWADLYTGKEATEENGKEIAWFKPNSDGKIHPVGCKLPNAWGIYDLCGNCDEWCRDYFAVSGENEMGDSTFLNPLVNPQGPYYNCHVVMSGGHATRVLRGGHRSAALNDLKLTRRGYFTYDVADASWGCRLRHEISGGSRFTNPTSYYQDLDTKASTNDFKPEGHRNPGIIEATKRCLDGLAIFVR